EWRTVLQECVRKELISDVPLGVCLSGGIDSGAVAAMMSRLSPGHVNSFSIGFTDRSFDESAYARELAQHLGTNHREMILEPSMVTDLVPLVTESLDEPLADASIVPTYLLARFARQHVTDALGDEPDVAAQHLAEHVFADPLNQVLYLDIKMYLENDILVKVDRASMMVSLEARVPLLNVDLVEHMAGVPVSLKLRGQRSKY